MVFLLLFLFNLIHYNFITNGEEKKPVFQFNTFFVCGRSVGTLYGKKIRFKYVYHIGLKKLVLLHP